MSRRSRWHVETMRSAMRENQVVLPLVSALLGVLLAFLTERFGPAADPDFAQITVAQARASGLAVVGLLFSALAILLALTALTAQNMASRFSPRLFRLKLRVRIDKLVFAAFALTGGYVMTYQVLYRTLDGDDLVPPHGPALSAGLFVLCSLMILWFINSSMQSLRVDRTIRWIARRLVRATELEQRAHPHDVSGDPDKARRGPDSIELIARDDGYVVDVDTDRLEELATAGDALVVIESEIGRPLVRGEPIGWVNISSPPTAEQLESFADCVGQANDRDPRYDPGYAINVLVDIALMALSPAVNDPHTAVQCVEELTVALTTLANRHLGPRARHGPDGALRVLVHGERVGDYLDSVGRKILLYGGDDPSVVSAVARLAAQVGRVAESEYDREMAASLARTVEAHTEDSARRSCADDGSADSARPVAPTDLGTVEQTADQGVNDRSEDAEPEEQVERLHDASERRRRGEVAEADHTKGAMT